MKGFENTEHLPMEKKLHLIHGSLLVLSELLRCSNAEWERTNRDIEENILHEKYLTSHSSSHNEKTLDDGEKPTGFGAVRRYYQSGFRSRCRGINYQ